MTAIVNYLISSKGIKLAGGTAAGAGSIIAVILGLHTDIKEDISSAEKRSKEYAKEQVMIATKINTLKFEYISNSLDEIKEMVKENNKRLNKQGD